MKYIVVGGVPFRSYTGTGSFIALKSCGVADSQQEVKKIVDEQFDACGGLIAVFDNETGEYAEIEGCQFPEVISPKAS